ncbi:P2Y purinoceptor 1 [Oryzias melastigma]|uniref:P2Y purinoceptor 1 n=1 Tax=Oryzias melastigma TaxID=30732 RepID=A0A834C979_ORYME|nr:P2Y purinoceptor 1 [Oryzias melastigma]
MNKSCTGINFNFEKQFLPPVYSCVFIVGLLANGWALKCLLQNWKKLGCVNVFVLNLGLADILYLLTLPFLMVYYIKDEWIFGQTACKITRFLFSVNLYCSLAFLTCISVYRYLAIVHPMRVHGRMTVTRSVAISALVWTLVIVQSFPDVFYLKTNANKSGCFDTTATEYVEDYMRYSLGWTFTGFVIPSVITLGCYGHIIVVLCRKNNVDKALKGRTLKLMIVLIVLFSVCYIPYHVFKNLNLWSRVLQKQDKCFGWFNGVYITHQMSRGLVSLNSALNPLVYLFVSEDIAVQIRKLHNGFRRLSSILFTNGQNYPLSV